MLQPEELYRILHQKPFRPLRVHVKDGRHYDVLKEELAVVGRTYFQIGVPAPNQPEPVYDYLVTLELPDIDRVEPLADSALRTT